MQIPLSNILITLFKIHVLKSPNEKNAFPLAKVNRLHDESLVVLFLIELVSKIVDFLRKNPSLWKEVKLRREGFMHSH